ncbi:SdrD B-like domain-containing protein [Aquisphaera giovannonii]|uniref:SdrD B-like domain-containing protein n=1 Tax=Aquisphaera giovannonii TaxID=406548 RepID=UPI0011DFF3C2|nr:SdrD B-like domain-containing protein [Aquisphaera giovannonii]
MRGRRPVLEGLEGRTLLASSILLDGLEFTGTFTQSGQGYTSAGAVLIGYAPTQGEAFNPLLSTDGLVTIPAADATSFTIAPAQGETTASLTLCSLSANPAFWATSSAATFDIGSLTSSAGQSLGAGAAQALTVSDVPFDATNLAFTIPTGADTSQAEVLLQGNLDFSCIGLVGLQVGVGTAGDGNDLVVTSGASASMTLTGVESSLQASFSAYGVDISGQITVAYSADTDTFSFGGSVTFSADGMVNVGASLGSNTNVVGGTLQAIGLDLPSSFDLFGLELKPQDLTFAYTLGANQFVMYGAVTASVSGTDPITATMGTAGDPGLAIDASNGTITTVNMSISGTFSLLGLQISCSSSSPPAFVYSAASGDYQITGSVTVPTLFNATLALGSGGNQGLTIDDDGDWSIGSLELSLGEVALGAFEIQQFVVDYTQTSSTVATVDVTMELAFPENWTVTGSIQLAINEATGFFAIQDISLAWQATSSATAIPIGDTGLFLTEMSAEVQNFNQPSNLMVSGTMEAVYGKQVTIFGQQASFFQVDGSFFADKDELSLSSKVLFGAVTSGGSTTGLLGDGNGTMTLDWDDDTYSLDTSSSMLDGAYTYNASFTFGGGGNILLSATADVNVPHGVPIIGGQKLGSLSFLFEYEPPSTTGGQAQGFIAAWTSIDLYVTHVNIGFEYNYVNDKFIVLGSGAINALENTVSSASETYTYSQSFTVPDGATQGTLEIDWTGNSVLAALTPTSLTVQGTGISDVSVTSSTTGTITLLPNTGYTTSTQALVGIVGSTSNPYAALAVQPGGTYTLLATFSSKVAPTDTSAAITGITEDPSTGDALVTFASGTVPGGIQVGDTVALAGTSSSGYNTSSSGVVATVQEITGSGVILNIPYNGAATGGTLSGWTLPQFSATWYIPPPSISVSPVASAVQTGSVPVTMPVQVASTLASNATVNLYIAPYDAALGTAQAFNGTLVAQGVPLSGATDNGNAMTGYTATSTVDLSGLLPTQYYFYAVVNDGTNAPVTSSLTGTDQVMEYEPVVSGTVANQDGTALSGWTVFVDLNGNGILEANDPSTTTNANGFYGFSSNQVPYGTPVDIVLVNLDPSAFSFGTPSNGVGQITYTGNLSTANFSMIQSSSIEGIAFDDANLSGDPSGQAPLSGWTVFLDTNGNGQFDAGEPWTLTSASGSYAFYGLTSGTTYTVDLVPNTGAAAIYSFQASAVSGNSVYDIAGDADALQQAGTLNGGATVVTSSSLGAATPNASDGNDQVLGLNGTSGYVSVAGNPNLQPGTGGFTVGAWVNNEQALPFGTNSTIAGTITSGAASGGWSLGLGGASQVTSQNENYGGSSAQLYTADFDHDNLTDILSVSAATGTVTVVLNTTTAGATSPTFTYTPYTYTVDNDGESLAAATGDFNADGLFDFAIADEANDQVLVFLNVTAAGSTTPAFQVITLADPNGPCAIMAETLNGADHSPDIVVANLDGTLTVFMNQTPLSGGTPAFTSQSVALGYSGPGVPNQIAEGEFNGDDSPDLVVGILNGPLVVLINTTTAGAATASFGTPTDIDLGLTSGVSSSEVAVGAFNWLSDGIAYIQSTATGNPTDTLYVLLSTTATGSSTFTYTTQAFTVGSNPSALVVTSLNGDFMPDIAVTSGGDSTVTILMNTTGNGATSATFTSATYDTIPDPTMIVAGNFYGSGLPDLAVGGGGALISILQNETNGTTNPTFGVSDFNMEWDDPGSPYGMVAGAFLGNGLDNFAASWTGGPGVNIAYYLTQTYLTAEVMENPSSGSGSFSTNSSNSYVMNDDTWYYVAFTYTPDVDSSGNDELDLYVNGVLVSQAIGLGTLPGSANISGAAAFTMMIGAEPGTQASQFLGGYLDDVSIWQSALTQAQIQALYGGGIPGTVVQTTPTNPGTYAVTISGTNDVVSGANFGEVQSATIIGAVTGTPLDSTTSGPLSGWTVELLNSDNQVVATTQTGSTGLYYFYGVMPGTYTIQEVTPNGWTQSGASPTLTAALDTVYTGENFTNTQTAQVSGDVYVDANNDGIQDDGEVGAAGATVYLDENHNGRLDGGEPTAVTQADGTYSFTGLAPGRYVVRVLSSPVGVPTQPSSSFYLADVTAHGSVKGLDFGLSPLVIAPIADVTVAEGSPVSFAVGLAHAVSGQPTVFYLAPGAPAGATIDPSTGLFSWTPTRPGTYTIVVNAVAAGTPLLTDSQAFTITVTDVAPVVRLGSQIQITLGDPFVRLGSFADPGTDPWTATVDYGDGLGPQPLLLGLDKTFELDHVYRAPGTYTVTVVIDDGEGGVGTASAEVVVLPRPTVVPPNPSPLSSGFGARRDAFVISLFDHILEHDPDPAGLSYWSGRLRAGASRLAVARAIWNSPEHHATHGGKPASRAGFAHAFRLARNAAAMVKTHAGAHARGR